MKLQVLILLGLLCFSCAASVGVDEEEWKGDGGEGEEEEMTEMEFDESFFGKKLSDLSDAEAAEEIRELVSLIDRDGDNQLDKEELIAYQIRLTEHNNKKQARRVMEKNDEDGNGVVTLAEIWLHSEEGDVPEESDMNEQQRNLKAKFTSADANGDGSLDQQEFLAFVTPERHERMIDHLVQDQLNAYDKDGDGDISRREYMSTFNPEGLKDDDLPEWVGDEKANFDYNLDKNQDGRLDRSEIRSWVVPDDATTFDVEARHILYNADTNRDRKVTVEELQAKFDVLIESSITNQGYAVHEEL